VQDITNAVDLVENKIYEHLESIDQLKKERQKIQATCPHPHDQQKLTLSNGGPWDHYKCLVCYKLYTKPSKASFE